MSDTQPKGAAFADRLTRTQWLLVLLLGVLLWLAGAFVDDTVVVLGGLALVFVSALGAKNTIRKG